MKFPTTKEKYIPEVIITININKKKKKRKKEEKKTHQENDRIKDKTPSINCIMKQPVWLYAVCDLSVLIN